HSSLEIAIRTLSWMWTVFMLLTSRSLDEPKVQQITRSLFQQIDHVHRYPSIYSSPNTHLIGEGTALFIAGLIFQELPRAAKWRQGGAAIPREGMQRQVWQAGFFFDLSPYYHCYAKDFFLQAVIVAGSLQLPVPKWMWPRLESMIEFVANLTRPD